MNSLSMESLSMNSDVATCLETHASARVFFDEWSGKPVLEAEALARGWEEGPSRRGYAARLASRGHVDSRSLEDHLTWLLGEVRARLPELAEAGTFRVDFFCYWVSARGHGGPDLSAALLGGVAEMGASLSFDVYFDGDVDGNNVDGDVDVCRDQETKGDWSRLRRQLVDAGESNAEGGTRVAQAAVERLLGPDVIHDAVSEYLSGGDWSELARSVLRLLRSPLARRACLETIREGDPDRRRSATELLRAICTLESAEVLRPLLSDADPEVAMWAAKGVDELALDLSDEALERWIQDLERSPVGEVRAVGAELRLRLDQRDSGSR